MKPYPKPEKREKKKSSKIKPLSDKRAKLEREYQKVRKEFLEVNRYCEICGNSANDIHHKGRRLGKLLVKVELFMAVCRNCHIIIHNNEKEAKQKGYLI